MKIKAAVILTICILAMVGCGKSDTAAKPEETQAKAARSDEAYEEMLNWYGEECARLNRELLEARAEIYVMENKSIPAADETSAPGDIQTSVTEPFPFVYHAGADGMIIDKYIGTDLTVSIPSEIDGRRVAEIGDNAFDGAKIVSAVIPDGIAKIGWFAFYNCADLREISIPASVASIGYGAFEYCSGKLTIKCPADSYAEKYAVSYAIRVERGA